MRCIIIDDEPLAREAVALLLEEIPELISVGSFSNARSAGEFMAVNPVDLVFLDIRMPGIDGIEFARTIGKNTLVIFTTAYSEYAVDSYEVDAIDYLVKPIEPERFRKAIEKAKAYHALLQEAEEEKIGHTGADFIFIKSERRYFKVRYEEILFVEGLKDYVIIQTANKRLITKMYIRTMAELLPSELFFRINKSYIVNLDKIDSFDNNDVFIGEHEISIGNTYREEFAHLFLRNKL